MGKIVAVVNQKGGVGKTTTTVNLASSLSLADKKVLLVDFDPQGNASSSVGISISLEDERATTYQVLTGQAKASVAIMNTGIDHLDLIPANPHLAGAEVELVNAFAREGKLKAALQEVKANYDYIFIDCPPTLGLLTVNALTAADSVLVPLQAEYFALEGLGQLMTTIDLIRQSVNPALQIEGIVLTMFNSQLKLSSEVEAEVRKHFGEMVFKTVIPRNIKLSECTSFGKPIVLYDVNSKGCIAYLDLAREVLAKSHGTSVITQPSIEPAVGATAAGAPMTPEMMHAEEVEQLIEENVPHGTSDQNLPEAGA
jgi:chromosome partitioning protein